MLIVLKPTLNLPLSCFTTWKLPAYCFGTLTLHSSPIDWFGIILAIKRFLNCSFVRLGLLIAIAQIQTLILWGENHLRTSQCIDFRGLVVLLMLPRWGRQGQAGTKLGETYNTLLSLLVFSLSCLWFIQKFGLIRISKMEEYAISFHFPLICYLWTNVHC